MDRWRGVLNVPLHPLARSCYRVAASLCLSPTSKTLIVPSANAIFFGGDRVAGTGNEVVERLSDLQNIAEILVQRLVVQSMLGLLKLLISMGLFLCTRTSYHLSINGESQSYTALMDIQPLDQLFHSCRFLEEVKSHIVRQEALPSPGISTSHCSQPKILIFGFSKGGTVLNQIVTELGFSDIELSRDELMEEKKISMEEDINIIPRIKETLLTSIREIHYVDVGLNSPGTYITDDGAIEKISKRLTQVDKGICFILHGTPRQWRDGRRSWICDEKDKLVNLLEYEAQRSGGKLQLGR